MAKLPPNPSNLSNVNFNKDPRPQKHKKRPLAHMENECLQGLTAYF